MIIKLSEPRISHELCGLCWDGWAVTWGAFGDLRGVKKNGETWNFRGDCKCFIGHHCHHRNHHHHHNGLSCLGSLGGQLVGPTMRAREQSSWWRWWWWWGSMILVITIFIGHCCLLITFTFSRLPCYVFYLVCWHIKIQMQISWVRWSTNSPWNFSRMVNLLRLFVFAGVALSCSINTIIALESCCATVAEILIQYWFWNGLVEHENGNIGANKDKPNDGDEVFLFIECGSSPTCLVSNLQIWPQSPQHTVPHIKLSTLRHTAMHFTHCTHDTLVYTLLSSHTKLWTLPILYTAVLYNYSQGKQKDTL